MILGLIFNLGGKFYGEVVFNVVNVWEVLFYMFIYGGVSYVM